MIGPSGVAFDNATRATAYRLLLAPAVYSQLDALARPLPFVIWIEGGIELVIVLCLLSIGLTVIDRHLRRGQSDQDLADLGMFQSEIVRLGQAEFTVGYIAAIVSGAAAGLVGSTLLTRVDSAASLPFAALSMLSMGALAVGVASVLLLGVLGRGDGAE